MLLKLANSLSLVLLALIGIALGQAVFSGLAPASGPGGHSASARLQDGSVSMTITPMFGWHSDWNRFLELRGEDGVLRRELFGDTGWWRGSHLYALPDGPYVLHEGQNGCSAFTLTPPAWVSAGVSCRKREHPLPPTPAGDRAPASRFYEGLIYLGRFDEGRGDAPPISFRPAAEMPEPEPELPDPL